MKRKAPVGALLPETKAERVPLRWTGHLPLAIRIVLGGEDEHGQTFTESTQTIGVDRCGARILTSHSIGLGAEVTVENRAVGLTARAKVVWRRNGASPGNPAEVVVELIEPSQSSIWGIRFPSRSDKKSTVTSASLSAVSAEKARECGSVAEPETRELIPSATDEPGSSPANGETKADFPAEWADMSNELEGLMSSLRKETLRSPETTVAETDGEPIAALQDDAERLPRSENEVISSANIADEEAVAVSQAALEEAEATFRARAEAFDKRLAELSISSIEDLQHRSESLFENFQHRMQTALDGLRQKGAIELAQSVQETAEATGRRSADQLRQDASGVGKSLTEELQSRAAALVDEAGKRLASVTQSCVERITESADTAREEGRLQAARALEEQTAAVARSTESAAQSVQLASTDALARLQEERLQTARALEEQTAAFARSAESAAQSIQLASTEALAKLQDERLQTARALEGQTAAIARGTDTANQSIQLASAEALAKLQEERLQAARALEERIGSVDRSAESVARSIQLASDNVLAKIEAARRQMATFLEADVDGFRRRLTELSTFEIEGLHRQADALLGSFESQLSQNTLQEFQQKVAQQVAEQIPSITRDLLERSANQLQKQADEVVGRLAEELKASRIALVDETREQITALTRTCLESLSGEARALDESSRHRLAETASQSARAAVDSIKLATEEAVTTLQTTRGKVQAGAEAHAEQYEKRLAELSASGIEELERRAGGLLESFRDRLQSTLNDLHQAGTTELSDQLRKVAEPLQERYLEQLQKRAADAFKASNDELHASRKALLDETREQTAAVVAASLESLTSKVQTIEEEARAKLDQTASQSVQRACDSIALAADEGVATMQTARAEVRASLDSQTEECAKRLAELSTSGVEEFRLTARGLRETFQGELQSTLDDFHRQGATELTERFRSCAGDLEQRCVEQLQRQISDAVQSLSDELNTSGAKLVDEAKQQLADTSQASLESFVREAKVVGEEWRSELAQVVSKSARDAADSLRLAGEQAVARLEATQGEAAARFTSDAESQRKLLTDLSASGREELQRTADSILDGFSDSLKEKARASFEQSADQLRQVLEQLTASGLRESSSKHEALVKERRKIFQDNIDLASDATLRSLTEKLSGLQQNKRRSILPKLALGLVALVPTILFVYFSARPVMRLRVDPPAEYLAAIDDAPPRSRATEERLARTYWDWAYLHLQHKYPFAAELPEDPPVEMMEAEGKNFPTGVDADLAKRRYWRKLRQIWAMPQTWEKSSLWEVK